MTKLSDKYIAGFLDSDGCIAVHFKKGQYKPLLAVHFDQKRDRDKVLLLIQEAIGGNLTARKVNDKSYSRLSLTGKAATMLLGRISKHLVVKRHYANVCLELVNSGKPIDPQEGRAFLKAQRKIESLPIPNYPCRKWLAGYFDGNGNFNAALSAQPMKRTGLHRVQLFLNIGCATWDQEGVKLVQKAFGGHVYHIGGEAQVYRLCLSPSKAKQVLPYFGKHLLLKKEQSDYILSCADLGTYRKGKEMVEHLKQLVAHEQRLNGSDAAYYVKAA
jgi:hypothetical protein